MFFLKSILTRKELSLFDNVKLRIEAISNLEFKKMVEDNPVLKFLAHYALDKDDIKFLIQLKKKNFSFENHMDIGLRKYTPLAFAIKTKKIINIATLIELEASIEDDSVKKSLIEILETNRPDFNQINCIKDIFNIMILSGLELKLDNRNRELILRNFNVQLIYQCETYNRVFGHAKIYIDKQQENFFDQFVDSLRLCLQKYCDLSDLNLNDYYNVENLGELRINKFSIAINGFGLKKIFEKIYLKNSEKFWWFIPCFSDIFDRASSKNLKFINFLKEDQSNFELLEKYIFLENGLKSSSRQYSIFTTDINSFLPSLTSSPGNSLSLLISRKSSSKNQDTLFDLSSSLDFHSPENSEILDPPEIIRPFNNYKILNEKIMSNKKTIMFECDLFYLSNPFLSFSRDELSSDLVDFEKISNKIKANLHKKNVKTNSQNDFLIEEKTKKINKLFIKIKTQKKDILSVHQIPKDKICLVKKPKKLALKSKDLYI